MIIYDNIGKVKQWIENLEFVINVVLMNMATSSIVNKRNYEKQVDTLKKEITLKENKAIEYKKEIEELKEYKKKYQKLQVQANNSSKCNKKLREKIFVPAYIRVVLVQARDNILPIWSIKVFISVILEDDKLSIS